MKPNSWITQGFDAFRRGTFGNSGHNLYVSKKGILQRIFQYDLNQDGYIDLVFANCQNHGESAPTYVYTLDGKRQEMPGQGCRCGMVLDIDGDGYQEILSVGYYDMAAPFASTDIYFGSDKGYSENLHTRIPAPWSEDACHGDLRGNGQQTLIFTMTHYKTIRLFEKTALGCYEWDKFTDLKIPYRAKLVASADLDGDGCDDLIVQEYKSTKTYVYWGSPDGIDLDNCTILPELPESEILQPEEAKTIESELEKKEPAARLLQTVRWNGKNCFTFSTGKKMVFYTADENRNIYRQLEVSVPMGMALDVTDLDGDGYDDIIVATQARSETVPDGQSSYIIWNGPEGLDVRPRTVLDTQSACHVSALDNMVLITQCNVGNTYTNDSLLFTYPNFNEPLRFEGEDPRRGFLIRNKDGVVRVALINRFSRSAIGYDDCFIYWGSKDGYSPDNMQKVPGHCAVDSLIVDFNDDGWAELLIGNNSENSGHLDVGHHMHYFGPNGFEPEKTHTLKTELGWGLVTGDFNRDGYLEVITPARHWQELRLYSAKDNFSTYEVIEMPEGCSCRWPGAVDLNNDGWLDLVVTAGQRNAIILWGGPEGFSMERSRELATYRPIGCAAADLTKNGYPDLIIGCHTETPRNGELIPHHPHHSYVHIYWNGPEGISESRKSMFRGDAADHMCIADFNGDGWLDLFVGNYHGGKDRDINSFLYWNREGSFSEHDKQLLFTHSASGCLAADFNEDGYIDLAVANHKVYGDHAGFSTVWWNGPKGFNRERSTDLPTFGPHGMVTTEIGNILDRSFDEYYYSEPITAEADCTVANARVEGDIPPKTAVYITMRVNDGEWVKPEELQIQKGDKVQYRLDLYAYNCLRTPRIEKVIIDFA